MKTITLTNTAQEQVQRLLKKLLALPFTVFLVMAVLPLLIFGMFYFDLIKPATADANADLEAAVAKVVTPSGVGTAFLVSERKLFTARHVIEGLPVGSTVEVILNNQRINCLGQQLSNGLQRQLLQPEKEAQFQ